MDIDLLIWLSLISLGIGLFAPIMHFTKLVLFKKTFSIYTTLTSLFKEEEYLLFLVIFLFSVVFPLLKIFLLSIIHYFNSWPIGKTQKYLHHLSMISKWSMLDVFIVAILVVIIRLDILGKVKVCWGIYVFAAAVIMSTLAVTRLQKRY